METFHDTSNIIKEVRVGGRAFPSIWSLRSGALLLWRDLQCPYHKVPHKGGGEETYDTLLQTSDDLTHLERSVLGDSVVVQTEFALQLNFW